MSVVLDGELPACIRSSGWMRIETVLAALESLSFSGACIRSSGWMRIETGTMRSESNLYKTNLHPVFGLDED